MNQSENIAVRVTQEAAALGNQTKGDFDDWPSSAWFCKEAEIDFGKVAPSIQPQL